jgi:hypothetical protein
MRFACFTILSLLCLSNTCWFPLAAQPGTGERSAIEVPFELVHDSILVQAFIDGHGPFSMLLDSGADPSIVDLEAARHMGLKLATTGQQGSGGGTEANLAYETSFPLLQLGALKASNVDALGLNLSKLSSTLGRPIAGVLGYSLLKNRIVQIDYPHHKVRFATEAPPCLAPPASHPCTMLPFHYNDDIVASGVTINGVPVLSNVDTGSSFGFKLTPAAVEKLHLSEEVARAKNSDSVGFNGDLKSRQGKVRNIAVGNISVDRPEVVFYGKGMGMDREPWDLRIGNGFLKNFVVTLDYPHGQILLTAP